MGVSSKMKSYSIPGIIKKLNNGCAIIEIAKKCTIGNGLVEQNEKFNVSLIHIKKVNVKVWEEVCGK